MMIDFRYLEYRILCIYRYYNEQLAKVHIFTGYSDIYESELKPAIQDVPE